MKRIPRTLIVAYWWNGFHKEWRRGEIIGTKAEAHEFVRHQKELGNDTMLYKLGIYKLTPMKEVDK